jgi:hypothetical protein
MLDLVLYIAMDLATGQVVSQNWPEIEEPLPVGSLVKPYTSLAYAQRHDFQYPTWDGRTVERALAESYNPYFLHLARQLAPADVSAAAARLGLAGPPQQSDAETLIGLGEAWRVPPIALLRAYRELFLRRTEPGIAPLLHGMKLAALEGTGSAIRREALVKTGTAPCSDGRHPGDGYAVAIHTGLIVLVRVEGRPGSAAAGAAGHLLDSLAVRR